MRAYMTILAVVAVSILAVVAVLVLPGCRVALPGTNLQYSRSQDSGTIRRSFGESHSYDTKILRVKQDARYTFAIDVSLKSGTATIELRQDEMVHFARTGDVIQEEAVVQLSAGEYMITIRTENAVDGRISIEYRSEG